MTDGDIREELSAAGLGEYADAILSLALPSVRFRSTATDVDRVESGEPVVPAPESTAIGVSKVGGSPDLPEGSPWPEFKGEAHAFVAQINLADLAGMGVDLLPATGLLSFFFVPGTVSLGRIHGERGACAVRYSGADSRLARQLAPDALPATSGYQPATLSASKETTLPPATGLVLETLQLPEDASDRYYDAELRRYPGKGALHRMLGYEDAIQRSWLQPLDCELFSQGLDVSYSDSRAENLTVVSQQWRLLLQVDSDDNASMNWDDSGRLFFWIRDSDLRDRDFSQVCLILESD